MDKWILFPILLPVIAGSGLLSSAFLEYVRAAKRHGNGKTAGFAPSEGNLKRIHILTGTVLVLTAVSAAGLAWTGDRSLIVFHLMKDIPICFRIDDVGRLFVTIVSVVWVAAGIYSFIYMKHEGEEKRYFGSYLIVFGILVALDFSGNLVTMYFFRLYFTMDRGKRSWQH